MLKRRNSGTGSHGRLGGNIKMINIQPCARTKGLVVQRTNDETLVFDLNSNKASCLNSVAGSVWNNCNGSNTVSEIASLVGKEIDREVSDDLVLLAVDQLSRNELLDDKIGVKEYFGGLNRRAFAKRVGLASVVALPVIASLIAPPSVLAQASACIGDCTCAAMGTIGDICAPSVPCANTLCQCQRINNGTGVNGTCIA